MFKVIQYEFEKIFKYKQLYIGIGGVSLLTVLFLFVIKTESSFMIPLTTLFNLNNLYIFVIALSLCSIVFGVELDYKTLKIIKCKTILPWKVVFSKYIVCITYVFMLFFIPFIISSVVGSLLLPQQDFELMGRGACTIILASQGTWLVIKAYLLQGIASIFIISFTMLLTIAFNSHIFSTLCTFFFILFVNVFGQLGNYSLNFISKLLPVNESVILRCIFYPGEFIFKMGMFLLFSLLFFIGSVFLYKRREVKI